MFLVCTDMSFFFCEVKIEIEWFFFFFYFFEVVMSQQTLTTTRQQPVIWPKLRFYKHVNPIDIIKRDLTPLDCNGRLAPSTYLGK